MNKQRMILFLGLVAIMIVSGILVGCQSQTSQNSDGNGQTGEPTQVKKDYNEDNVLIKVATNPEYIPFTYYEQMVGIVGFDVDILTAMAEAGNYQLQFINMYWDDMLTALEENSVDLATSAISHQEQLASRFDYSPAYINTSELKDYIIRQEAEGVKVNLSKDTDFVFLLAKGNDDLKKLLDESYQKIKSSGKYNEIFNEYFGPNPTKGFLDPNIVIMGGS